MDTDQFCESFTELYDLLNYTRITRSEFDLNQILDNLQKLGVENPLNILRNGGEGMLLTLGEDLQTDEMLLQQACWLCEYRMKRDETPLGWEGRYPFHPIRNVSELKEWMRCSLDELLSAEDRSREWCREKGTEIIRNASHAFYSLGIESPSQPEDPSDGNEAVRIIRNLLAALPTSKKRADKLARDEYKKSGQPQPNHEEQFKYENVETIKAAIKAIGPDQPPKNVETELNRQGRGMRRTTFLQILRHLGEKGEYNGYMKK